MMNLPHAQRAAELGSLPARPLSDVLGAEITDVDLDDFIARSSKEALWQALAKYGVLVFRDQDPTAGSFVRISRFLGELEFHVLDQYRMEEYPEVYVISNIVKDGKPLGNPKEGFGWHTDLSYMQRPTAYTVLYGSEVPVEGADTLYCNTRMAYAKLQGELKARVQGLKGIHSYVYMRTGNSAYRANNEVKDALRDDQVARVPDVVHPVVRTHPVDGSQSLYIGGDCLAGFVGMDPVAGKELGKQLFDFVLQPQFQFAHKWRKNDVVIWDNRFTMHTATEYDREKHRRLIWRTSVKGEIPA